MVNVKLSKCTLAKINLSKCDLTGAQFGEFAPLEGHTSPVWSVAFSPDGRFIASGSGDKTVKVWELETAQTVHTLRGHTSEVSSVAFSPDGRFIASGSWDETMRVWELETCLLYTSPSPRDS